MSLFLLPSSGLVLLLCPVLILATAPIVPRAHFCDRPYCALCSFLSAPLLCTSVAFLRPPLLCLVLILATAPIVPRAHSCDRPYCAPRAHSCNRPYCAPCSFLSAPLLCTSVAFLRPPLLCLVLILATAPIVPRAHSCDGPYCAPYSFLRPPLLCTSVAFLRPPFTHVFFLGTRERTYTRKRARTAAVPHRPAGTVRPVHPDLHHQRLSHRRLRRDASWPVRSSH